MRERRTYFVVSSYAGALQYAWVRGAYSSRGFASREREYLEKVLGPHIVVRVIDAGRVPKGLTIYC